MLTYEYKLAASKAQYAAIDEAIRVCQFIRNTCLRLWMDQRGIGDNDLQKYCAVLAHDYPFANRPNSTARQVAADRAWSAISRFYANCKAHIPGKKGYPRFARHTRSVEYKRSGWKLEPDGRHLTFTDGCGIGRLRLVGTRQIETFPTAQIKRADGYYAQFCVQAQRSIVHCSTGAIVGIDVGLNAYTTDSNGNTVDNVRNRHLAKSISDAAWGRFLAWIRAYGMLHAIPIIKVAPRFTSQHCSQCKMLVKKSLSVRTHICPSCGLVMDRDENAARNILKKAIEDGTAGQAGTNAPLRA